jgi:hypothetical protein
MTFKGVFADTHPVGDILQWQASSAKVHKLPLARAQQILRGAHRRRHRTRIGNRWEVGKSPAVFNARAFLPKHPIGSDQNPKSSRTTCPQSPELDT